MPRCLYKSVAYQTNNSLSNLVFFATISSPVIRLPLDALSQVDKFQIGLLGQNPRNENASPIRTTTTAMILRRFSFIMALVRAIIMLGTTRIETPLTSASHPMMVMMTCRSRVHVLWNVRIKKPIAS